MAICCAVMAADETIDLPSLQFDAGKPMSRRVMHQLAVPAPPNADCIPGERAQYRHPGRSPRSAALPDLRYVRRAPAPPLPRLAPGVEPGEQVPQRARASRGSTVSISGLRLTHSRIQSSRSFVRSSGSAPSSRAASGYADEIASSVMENVCQRPRTRGTRTIRRQGMLPVSMYMSSPPHPRQTSAFFRRCRRDACSQPRSILRADGFPGTCVDRRVQLRSGRRRTGPVEGATGPRLPPR